MTEDATLSSFQRSETDENDGEEPADTSSEAEGETEPDDEAPGDTNGDVEPATSTYVWGTYTCDDCEETVARAWREDERLVCPVCKDW